VIKSRFKVKDHVFAN